MIKRRWGVAKHRFSRTPLLWNSLTLMSGSLAGQALVLLASPVLARMFRLSDFGDLANFSAWTAILALISNLRYEHAVIVARGEDETYGVMALTGLLSILASAIVGLLAGALYLFYAGDGYLAELRRVALFLPAGVLAIALTSLFIQHHVKTGRFKRLTVVTALQVVVTITSQIVLGILGVGHALIVGTIVGFAFSALVFARYFFLETSFRTLVEKATLGQLSHHARLFRNFPRYTMAADGIAVVVQRFVPVLVLAWFSPAIAGLYAFSLRAVRMPLLMLAHPVVGALRKEAADRVHAGHSLLPLFLATTRGLLAVSVVPFLILALFSEPIFVVVFGPQWADAGRVVEILSPGILLEFIAIPTAVFFLVTDTQHLTFGVQLVGFMALVAALAIGRYLFDDFITTCYLLSAVMVVANGAALWMAGRVSKRPTRNSPEAPGETAGVAAS